MSREAEELLARYVEHHVREGTRPDPESLCRDRPDLLAELRRLVARYHRIEDSLDTEDAHRDADPEAEQPDSDDLPRFDGFVTVERIGRGGMGEVYKVKDLRLGRTVAAKVLRADLTMTDRYAAFVREARSLALFGDPRIVQIHEFRTEGPAPVILMEYVDGFDLASVAPSLEFRQRAKIVREVCDALQRAHDLGIQHRDLKPANILLDQRLAPKIVDFGLARSDPRRGHLLGSLPYLAPEQLDPARAIDARTDVYALGVILYEILCGERPWRHDSVDEMLEAIRESQPPLPVEVDPEVPEPLQAVALRAMEKDPGRRYPSVREMARDLDRYLEGRPVLARPTVYGSILERRIRPHLEHIEEWLRLRLIYPHEAERLGRDYRRLESREEDWIVQSRVLSYSQIALYLGAFVLVCGALLYFGAHRFHEAVEGVFGPFLVLGVPFLGLNVAAAVLYRREHRAVAVAFHLGGVLLLPLFLLILFHEAGWWAAAAGDEGQFFPEGTVSNRQLQVAGAGTLAWATWLALRTRTVGLSSMATALLALTTLTVLTDLGLRFWLEDGRWDLLALHLVPLLAVQAVLAASMDRSDRSWFARPLYVGSAALVVAVLELLSLDGRAFGYLGVSMARFQAEDVADPVLLDTLTAMALAGVVFYVLGNALERRGSAAMGPAAWILVVLSPFAVLEPIAWLVHTGEYSARYDWLYLAAALATAWISHHRQRKSFYLAGLVNTGAALWIVTDHRAWFDRPAWAIAVVIAGLGVLAAGFVLAVRERNRRRV